MNFQTSHLPGFARELFGFQRISQRIGSIAGWMAIGLAAILPFRTHTKTLELIFLYGGLLLFFVRYLLIDSESPKGSEAKGNGMANRLLSMHPFFWPIALFAITGVISCFYSYDRHSSFGELRRQLLQLVLVFILVMQISRNRHWRGRALAAFFVAGIGSSVYGIIFYYDGSLVEAGRALGAMTSYTRSAMYLILWMPLMAAVFLFGGQRLAVRILVFSGLVLGWWFAILTQTRGAIAVIFLAVIGLAAMRHWRWTAAFAGVCLIVAFSLPMFNDRIATTLEDLSHPNALLSDRLPLWKTAADVIRENPLRGIGYGSEIYQQTLVRETYPMFNYKYQPHAHNFYLQAASESGILHLAGLLWLFLLSLVTIGGRLMQGVEPPGLNRALLLGVFFGLVAMLIYGMVGHFHETRIAMSLWYLIALALGAAPLDRGRDIDSL